MLSSYRNAKRIAAQSKPVRLARWFKKQAVVRGNGPGILTRSECRDLSAEEWRAEVQAEQRLATMDLVEDLAVLVDTEGCAGLRRQMADQYRAAVGVSPKHRQELRAAMERVKAGGGMPVADVVDLIHRDHHANGSV